MKLLSHRRTSYTSLFGYTIVQHRLLILGIQIASWKTRHATTVEDFK